jgi:hypothetical protein
MIMNSIMEWRLHHRTPFPSGMRLGREAQTRPRISARHSMVAVGCVLCRLNILRQEREAFGRVRLDRLYRQAEVPRRPRTTLSLVRARISRDDASHLEANSILEALPWRMGTPIRFQTICTTCRNATRKFVKPSTISSRSSFTLFCTLIGLRNSHYVDFFFADGSRRRTM